MYDFLEKWRIGKVLLWFIVVYGAFAGACLTIGLAVPTLMWVKSPPTFLGRLCLSSIEVLLLALVVDSRMQRDSTTDAISKYLVKFVKESGDFREALAESASQALREKITVGYRITSQAEWGAMVERLTSDPNHYSIVSQIYISSMKALENILDKLEDNIITKNKTTKNRLVIFTVNYYDNKFHKIAQEFFDSITKFPSRLEGCNCGRLKILVGNSAEISSTTIIDHKSWFFSTSEERDNGILFLNDESTANELAAQIYNRWTDANSPHSAREPELAKQFFNDNVCLGTT